MPSEIYYFRKKKDKFSIEETNFPLAISGDKCCLGSVSGHLPCEYDEESID